MLFRSKPVDEEVTPVLVPKQDNVKPIILKIPNAIQADMEALEKWLDVQKAGILKKFGQSV